MVNIWKVGAWPGLWTDDTNPNSKEKFASDYAIPRQFIAIGSGYLPDVTGWSIDRLVNIIQSKTDKNDRAAKSRARQVDYFCKKMKIEDIVFLYMGYGDVYIGEIKSDYYYVEKGSVLDFIKETDGDNYAPHRRDVKWKYNGSRYEDVYFDWNDVVHKIEESDLDRVKNPIVKRYLEIAFNLPYLK